MSWLTSLYKTYENLSQVDGGIIGLLPIAHTTQNAQIEVTINQASQFVSAMVVEKKQAETLIPCTEESAGRSGKTPIHHPLMDKLQYMAADYAAFGGEKGSKFHVKYIEDLRKWCSSNYSNKKVKILLQYLEKGNLISDLVEAGVLHCDKDSKLIEKWTDKATTPEIYKVTPGNQSDAFVRFRVICDEDNTTALWEDQRLQNDYIKYYLSRRSKNGVCSVTGEECSCTVNHPNKIRNTGDKAKLISANDSSGLTYKGRFLDFDEAALISYEISQKAHNALKYLIKKQGRSYGSTKVFLLWSAKGFYMPGIYEDSLEALLQDTEKKEYTAEISAKNFNDFISGFRCKDLQSQEDIAIIGVDSATTGRMAITFYREILQNELVDRVLEWHKSCEWKHRYHFDKDNKLLEFMGAPSPKDIALAAFGTERTFLEIDNKLGAVTVERVLHCIIDGDALPYDIVQSAFRNVCHPQNYKNINNWRKVLSICCSLVKKYKYDKSNQLNREEWTVELQKECTDLAYLCGRMLAVADMIEGKALYLKGETRETAAMRYFTKFQEHPNSTWMIICKSLIPYFNYLENKVPGLKEYFQKRLEEISSKIPQEEFKEAKNLDGTMALGFFSQLNEGFTKKVSQEEE